MPSTRRLTASMKQGSGRGTDPLASNERHRDEVRLGEQRHRADGWSLRQFRKRGWIGAVLVALFGGIAAFLPYYSPLVLLGTMVATITTLLAWLLISLLSHRYTPALSVHFSSLVFIFVALALLSVSVGTYRPGSGVGARLLGLSAVTFTATAVVGWLWPSRRVHDGPVFGSVLAAGLCLAAFLKLLPRAFVTRYVVAVLGLLIVAAVGYSWLAFVKRWRTGAAPP